MLERIREGAQGTWASVILGLVILSFVFAGVGSYITSSGELAAAKVNGEEIPASALERAYQNERARMEQQFGEAFAGLFSDEAYLREFRQGVLERLIADKLIEQQAIELGLRVSDTQIKSTILNMPEFQIGGEFDNDRYLAILRQAGYQPSSFRDYLRTQMTREQLARALNGSEFNLPAETRTLHRLHTQTRDMRYVTIPATPFQADVEATEAEQNAYYQANQNRYDTEEKVRLAYVELSADDLISAMEATEQELNDYYQENMTSYSEEEQRRASHILISFGEDEDAAQAKAEALLSKIKTGEDFAELAKAESSDSFTAENGGDLDWFGKGVMDPAFEQATFALQNAGDLSEVVRSDFGFHIIKLTDIKPPQVTPFAEVREGIEQAVLREKAMEEFYSVQQAMAEVAFEVPDSLDDTAAVANKEIQTSELFARTAAPAKLNNPAILSAAFSDDLIQEGVNSDSIELGDEHIIFLRVVEHEPQRTKPFDEVKGEIEQTLVAEKAQDAAMLWAEGLVQSIADGGDIQVQLDEKGLSWQAQAAVTRNAPAIDRSLSEELFRLAPEQSQNTSAVKLAAGDVALLQLSAVNAGKEVEEAQLSSLQQRFAVNRSQAIYTDMIESMRNRADIEIFNL